MKTIVLLFVSILLSSCNEGLPKTAQVKEPYIVYKEKENKTLTDIAYDLLRFEKYEMALELIQGDTSITANDIRSRVFEARGQYKEAIELDIRNLRQYDGEEFFEGSWILCDLYELCLNKIDYSIALLEKEIERSKSNYQTRLLMMKLLWTSGDDLALVVKLGDDFRKELPDMSSEVSFNHWRDDALDSLAIKQPEVYESIMSSYKPAPWNGVEVRHN
jgi:tetratricopeptide (TPR) repeat protein